MNAILRPYLDDLESRIDESAERQLHDQWERFCFDRIGGGLFDPRRREGIAPKINWPHVRTNATLDDFDQMLLQQYATCSQNLANADGRVMMVRANYGTPILAVPFGAELFVMPDDTDTLPAAQPIEGGAEALRRIVDRGEPSLEHPYLSRVFETGRRMRDVGRAYPKIGRWIPVYHPDLQGPMDVLDLLLGAQLFELLYDEPELVHQALDLITRTYIRVMEAWEQIIPRDPRGVAGHWGFMHRGTIMIRDDSAMNISAEMFDEFVRPYDQRLLDHFGGGAIHACGRVAHFIDRLAEMPGLYAFNFGQFELNDAERCLSATIDRGILLLGLPGAAAERRDLRGRAQAK